MKKLPFEKKKKLRKLSAIKNEVWNTFAKVMRQKGAENGKIKCISCDRTYPVGDSAWNSGHFKHGKFTKKSGFYENNIWPQCVFCNCGGGINGGGDYIAELYEEALVKKLGQEEVDHIKSLAKQIWKPTRDELNELLETYKAKLLELESKPSLESPG